MYSNSNDFIYLWKKINCILEINLNKRTFFKNKSTFFILKLLPIFKKNKLESFKSIKEIKRKKKRSYLFVFPSLIVWWATEKMFFWNERKNKKIRKNTLEKYSKYYLSLEFWISCFFWIEYQTLGSSRCNTLKFYHFNLKTYSSVLLCGDSKSVYRIEISLFNKKLLRLECFWHDISM